MEKVGQIYKNKNNQDLYKIKKIKDDKLFCQFKRCDENSWNQYHVFNMNYFEVYKSYFELIQDVEENLTPLFYVSKLSRVE